MFTDTHCHLTTEELQNDIEGVVKRANDCGVTRVITAGTDFNTSQKAVEFSKTFSQIFATVGLHPEEAMEMTMEEIDREIDSISSLIAHRQPQGLSSIQSRNPWDKSGEGKIVAVGEIGMDRHRVRYIAQEGGITDFESFERDSIEKQKYALEQQLQLALETNLPVVIHCRDSEKDLLRILSRFTQNGGRGVLHSFTGDELFLEHFVSLGWYVSFNGIVTFKNGENVRELCRKVPVEQILLETDAPFLAPEPHRGKVCEPQYVVEIAQKIAEIKDVSIGDLEIILEENVQRLFDLYFLVEFLSTF